MDKLKRLLTMAEQPDRYSEDEWDDVLGGERLTDEEKEQAWQRFERRHWPGRQAFWRNTAALLAAVLTLSALAWTAFHLHTHQQNIPETVTVEPTNAMPSAAAVEPIVFENAPLETILDTLSRHYGFTVSYRNAGAKARRLYFTWDRTMTEDEAIALFNNFESFSLTLSNDILEVE
ncbi:MAG: DUF4974 domain-containing protein [Prevotella sp.]|nr:DUF4974 domain-containing protein [Prevotella sp.]